MDPPKLKYIRYNKIINNTVLAVLSFIIYFKTFIFRISYAALYNVSIFSNGASGHMINAELIKVLNSDIEDSNTMTDPHQQFIALQLLHSLLRNVCTKTTYKIMKNNVSIFNYMSNIMLLYSIECNLAVNPR